MFRSVFVANRVYLYAKQKRQHKQNVVQFLHFRWAHQYFSNHIYNGEMKKKTTSYQFTSYWVDIIIIIIYVTALAPSTANNFPNIYKYIYLYEKIKQQLKHNRINEQRRLIFWYILLHTFQNTTFLFNHIVSYSNICCFCFFF